MPHSSGIGSTSSSPSLYAVPAAPPAGAAATSVMRPLDTSASIAASNKRVQEAKTDAVDALKLTEADLMNASLEDRKQILETLESRKGYWTGIGGVLGFIFVDILLFGWIWNKHGIAYSLFTEADRDAVNRVLTTTPADQAGKLVADMTATGLRERLMQRMSGEAEEAMAARFFKMNIHGLPTNDIAREMRWGYNANDAATVLGNVSNTRGVQTAFEVTSLLSSNGGLSNLIPEITRSYNPNDVSGPDGIMFQSQADAKARLVHDNQQDAMKRNPVYSWLSARTRSEVDARFEQNFTTRYDVDLAAKNAVDSAPNMLILADTLAKIKLVMGKDKFNEVATRVTTSEAFHHLLPFNYWQFRRDNCRTQEDYNRIERSLDNFDYNYAREPREQLQQFLTRSGLGGTPIGNELNRALEEKISTAKGRIQVVKAECRAEISSFQFQQYRDQVEVVDRLNRQLIDLQGKLSTAVAANKPEAELKLIRDDIDRVQRRRDDEQRKLDQMPKPF